MNNRNYRQAPKGSFYCSPTFGELSREVYEDDMVIVCWSQEFSILVQKLSLLHVVNEIQ
jgi:hypothetical protein